MSEKKNTGREQLLRESGKFFTLGAEIFTPVLLGVLIGHFLIDSKQGTSPKWTLILAGIGMAVGIYNMIKAVSRLNKKSRKN